MAQAGTELLAKEIVSFWKNRGKGKPLSVCVPGGTCSTAVLLHRSIQKLLEASPDKLDIAVVVIPCVGDDAYARRQMMGLNTQTGGSTGDIPAILAPSPYESYFGLPKRNGYYNFGEPDASILETFRELRDEHEVVLDLIYGAPSWTIMLRHWRTEAETGSPFDPSAPLAGREVMYVHSGGLEGISSQLLRYRHKGLIDSDEIQLPGRPSGKVS
jgi:1-aminocyclopropane-1-carboxylate deaminase